MNLAERLLNPETVEEALEEIELNNFDFSQMRDAFRELHKRAEQYRQNWLSLQNATGEDCHLRALEVVREIPELHRRLAAAKLKGAAEAYEAEAREWEEMARPLEHSINARWTRQHYDERAQEAWNRAAALRKQADAAHAGGTR